MDSATVRIGWIGLGTMGLEMARNLQKHRESTSQTSITVFNRTPSKCEHIKKHGARVATSPAEVAEQSDLVFLSLVNDDAVKEIIIQLLESAASSATTTPLIIADTTTVHPSTPNWTLDQISNKSTQRPVKFCQTPVWGAPPAAKSASLVFVASGSNNELLASIAVPAFARTTIYCDSPVRAAKFKIMGNFMIASIIESLGEALAVADEAGIGRELYLEFVQNVLPVPPVLGYAQKMVGDGGEASKHQVGFNIKGGMKDVGYAIDVAKSVGMRLPVAELAYEHLQWVLDNGDEGWDWSSLAFALRKNKL
ncbi:hypothetical protein IWW50_000159 [Coemansia erecta]|nr:hypothetical protein GGF43_000502 [Coemansia sp. RSA 2618]KAJ2830620.1 hypothetical protein IWW50_000159 [Coemansia erecta]